jgi:hypothetical protein
MISTEKPQRIHIRHRLIHIKSTYRLPSNFCGFVVEHYVSSVETAWKACEAFFTSKKAIRPKHGVLPLSPTESPQTLHPEITLRDTKKWCSNGRLLPHQKMLHRISRHLIQLQRKNLLLSFLNYKSAGKYKQKLRSF